VLALEQNCRKNFLVNIFKNFNHFHTAVNFATFLLTADLLLVVCSSVNKKVFHTRHVLTKRKPAEKSFPRLRCLGKTQTSKKVFHANNVLTKREPAKKRAEERTKELPINQSIIRIVSHFPLILIDYFQTEMIQIAFGYLCAEISRAQHVMYVCTQAWHYILHFCMSKAFLKNESWAN
jgi:hypothetical protein